MPATFSGSVADNTGGVGLAANSTTFTLRRGSDGFYWTGSAWQAAAFSLAATNGATTGNTAATWTAAPRCPPGPRRATAPTRCRRRPPTRPATPSPARRSASPWTTTAPATASVTTPAGGSLFRAATVPATFSGSVADNAGGAGLAANSTTFTLQRSSDGFYWTGSGWQSAVFNLGHHPQRHDRRYGRDVDGQRHPADLVVAGRRHLHGAGRATDKVGNTFTGAAVSFTLDKTAPATASVTTPAGGSSFRAAAVPASFSGSVADNTGGVGLNANSTTFTLRRGDSFYWTGSGWCPPGLWRTRGTGRPPR